jgi:enoyl-[acyl-carrier-protein] reductase (NADH)
MASLRGEAERKESTMKSVIVVIGPGSIGQAIARRVGAGKRGARVNTISPGIIITPLAHDELTGPRGEGYRRMVEGCPVGRAGTPDEVGNVAALLMGPDGAFITGSDFLMDGGVTASYFFGELAPKETK